MAIEIKTEKEIFLRVVKTITKMMALTNKSISFEIKGETDIYSDLGIDSVEVMDLLGLLEKEFEVTINVEQAVENKTVNDIVRLLVGQLRK